MIKRFFYFIVPFTPILGDLNMHEGDLRSLEGTLNTFHVRTREPLFSFVNILEQENCCLFILVFHEGKNFKLTKI